MHQLRLIL